MNDHVWPDKRSAAERKAAEATGLLADTPPAIDTIDDLLSRKEMAAWFGITERHLQDYMYGDPPLPFFRHTNKDYRFSKKQVAWWYMKMQGKIDPMIMDIRRARREAKRAARRKTVVDSGDTSGSKT